MQSYMREDEHKRKKLIVYLQRLTLCFWGLLLTFFFLCTFTIVFATNANLQCSKKSVQCPECAGVSVSSPANVVSVAGMERKTLAM